MISEEHLRAAAQRSWQLYTAAQEQGYDQEEEHVFSPSFERKIHKLSRRAAHPFLYRPVCRAASVVLAVALTGSAWLTFDAGARAAVLGWVKGIQQGAYFVYHRDEASATAAADMEAAQYQLTWIPEGYTHLKTVESGATVMNLYADQEDHLLQFSYAAQPETTDWFVVMDGTELEQTTINGQEGDLLLSHDPDVSSALMWVDEDQTAFMVVAFLDEEGLIRLAESVEKLEP